jgi:uncharacterized Ntn-hydrolase superfamily protein
VRKLTQILFVVSLLSPALLDAQGKMLDRSSRDSLPPVSTFSIVARDAATGQMGVAVASRYFSVGSVVPWAEANVGAVATQANVNVGYGRRGLELLRQGLSAQKVVQQLLAEDTFEGKDGRQVAVVDAKGNIAAFTGPNAPVWAGDRQGKTWSAQGNILVGPQVPEAMGKAFEETPGELAEKMYAALKAGDAAGGDKRGRQSASMLIVCDKCGRNINNDRYLYINVDDNPDPFTELRRLLDIALLSDHQDSSFKLLTSGKYVEARDAAAAGLRYAPERPGIHMNLGMLNYLVGDKTAALAEFQKAKQLDPDFQKSWDTAVQNRAQFKAIVSDEDFMKKLFPKE